MSLIAKIKAVAPGIVGRTDVIEQNQDIADIIREVVEAHEYFAPDYDKIATVFYEGGYMPEEIPAILFDLLKKHVRYEEEPESTQTTRSPKLLLTWGHGDCKHYSGFIAGVLDAYNRIAGKKVFNWSYRFASYDIWSRTPKHVFVVWKKNGEEIWIDPVLKSYNQRTPAPTFVTDKVVNTMALKRLSGLETKGVDITTVFDRTTLLATCSGLNNGEVVRIGNVEKKGEPVNELLFVSPSKKSTIGAVSAEMFEAQKRAWDATPLGSVPPGGINKMGRQSIGGSSADLTTLIPGVYYISNGELYRFPPNGSKSQLPQDLQVVYPTSFSGKVVPQNLPKPVVVGNRLMFLPKILGSWLSNQDTWADFLTRVMYPLVLSHGNGWMNNIEVFKQLVWGDQDYFGHLDYVTGNPYYLPGVEFAPAGVKYFADTERSVPLYFPPARNTWSVEEMERTPPPPIPPGLTVEYPATWNGVPVPSWMPKPTVVNGGLQLLPKNNNIYATDPLRQNNFFWLTFLTGVMMPLVSSFAQYPYNTKNEKLSGRILLDLDDRDIDNYLNAPEKAGTFFGNLIRSVIDVVKDVAAFGLKFAALGPRTAFLGLVRLNVRGFATNLAEKLSDGKMIDTWKQIGGSEGDLRDAIEDGSKKNRLLGIGCNCATVGAEPISVGAALAAAAPIIAIMAHWLKGQVPEAAGAIDAALNAMNRAMFEAGYDPIGLGNDYDKPIEIADPNNPGGVITVPPAPPVTGTVGFFDNLVSWVKNNKLLAGGIAVGGYLLLRKRRQRRRAS